MSNIAFGTTNVSAATGGRSIDGDGPLVMLIHGAAMNRSVWSLQTRWLAHHGVAAIAIDLPGHGASTEAERASVADYADWVAQLVGATDRSVHLVGHSMGSFIAMETAVRADVASVTLVGTATSMPVHPALLDAAESNDPLAAQLMSGWAFAAESKTGPHPSPGSSTVGGTQALIGQAAPGVLHHDLAMCADYGGAADAVAAINAPLTFLLGSEDRMTPVRNAQPLLDAAPDSTVVVVPNVGHMIMIEAPAITRQAIVDTATAGGNG